ncbi:alpha/beta fold hydrolase [Arthrobacter sp. Sa2CUA1]|uniref:Alpha/beta fold hydrolase n=1 Tax=Arthrobacter gallicola TaxID=2762225 RepID=A0ABR8UW11_9MICC|nr:alpha/beta fold hydrolase [Arthrobacter gallicola]MBD7996708.1 alpha/beta fold hydrolase [Arthrobacter gallicola]
MPAFESVSFPGANGTTLAGTLDIPNGDALGWAVFCHGFALGKNSAAASRISKRLSELGIGVLRYDAAGLGRSTGTWEDGSFSTKVADLLNAVDYLRSRDRSPTLLLGHSLGGAAALAAAARIPELAAVVSIAAPFRPSHVAHLFEDELDTIAEQGQADVVLGGRTLRIRQELVADLYRHDLSGGIAGLQVPLLVMHSPDDLTVGIENATEIFQAAPHPRSFVALDGADHLLTDRNQTDRAAAIIAAWAGSYLCPPEESRSAGCPPDPGS